MFRGLSGNNYCHGNTFKIFLVLKFVGVTQPKPMNGLSPNYQDMLTPKRIYRLLALGGYLATGVSFGLPLTS